MKIGANKRSGERSAAGKPSGRIRGPGSMARVQAGGLLCDGLPHHGRPESWPPASAVLRADRAPTPQVAKPWAGLSSDQRIDSPGSQPPVTGVDLRWHGHQPCRSAWSRQAAGMIKPPGRPLRQRVPWSGTTGRRAAMTAGARRSPRSAPTPVAPSRASLPRQSGGSARVISAFSCHSASYCRSARPRDRLLLRSGGTSSLEASMGRAKVLSWPARRFRGCARGTGGG